jgi:hypothetical protein
MFINEPLFATPHQHGLMYLMLPIDDARLTKTEIKVGWSTDRAHQRQRRKAHRRESPGMETVALWPATRAYEENWHARQAADAIPGRKEWYFPTLAIIQAIRHEVRAHDEQGTLTWLAAYTEWKLVQHLTKLLTTADEIEFLMSHYRQAGTQ